MFESLLAHPTVANLRDGVAPMRNGLHAAKNGLRAHVDELWRKFAEPNTHEHTPPAVTLFQERTQQRQTPKTAAQPNAVLLGRSDQRMTSASNLHQPPHNLLSVQSWVEPSKPTPLPEQTHANVDPYAQYRTPPLHAQFSWKNVSDKVLDLQARGYDKEARARAAKTKADNAKWERENPGVTDAYFKKLDERRVASILSGQPMNYESNRRQPI
jgi:hypothetical protein